MGTGLAEHTNERNDVKIPALNKTWFVRNQLNGHGVWILLVRAMPLKDDGERDKFADLDVAIRRANASEDVPWSFRREASWDTTRCQGVQEQDIYYSTCPLGSYGGVGSDQMADSRTHLTCTAVVFCWPASSAEQ